MDLKISFGKQTDGEDVSLDFAKQNLNMILLLGATGSGKSVFHFHLYKELLKQNKQEDLGFIFIDNTHHDFYHFHESNLFRIIRDRNKAFVVFGEIIEEVKARNLGLRNKEKALFVHIEECDQWPADEQKTEEFYREFLKYKEGSNVFVIYSTSRPSVGDLPDWLISGADLKVVFKLASETDCGRVLGNTTPLSFTEPGERLFVIQNKAVHCKPFNSDELKEIEDFENQKNTQ